MDSPRRAAPALRVDGRLLHTTARARFRRLLRAKQLRPGLHRVTVRARDKAGNATTRSVRFHRCPSR